MNKDAEKHASEDKQRRENIEARNAADSATYVAERALKDLGDKADANMKSQIEEKVKAIRETLNNKDADTASLQRMTSELNQIMQQLGAAAYGAAGQPGGAGMGGNPGGDGGTPPDDNVVDGEFKEK